MSAPILLCLTRAARPVEQCKIRTVVVGEADEVGDQVGRHRRAERLEHLQKLVLVQTAVAARVDLVKPRAEHRLVIRAAVVDGGHRRLELGELLLPLDAELELLVAVERRLLEELVEGDGGEQL